jgi:hypothetical protein
MPSKFMLKSLKTREGDACKVTQNFEGRTR